MSRPRRIQWNSLFIYLSAILICSFSILPILWVISTSFKPQNEVFALPPNWLPIHTTLDNYFKVITNPDMLRYFLNTIIIAAGSTMVSLLVAVGAAYGFSRYRFPGSGTVLVSIQLSRVLPRVVLIIPFFVTLRKLHLFNTYGGLILVYLMIGMPISIWLLKGFFDNIPREIEEAGIIDGCSPLGVLLRIVIPIARPAIGAVGMYSFILAWNEFLFALVLTSDISTQPISVGLAFYQHEHGISWGPLMAASVLMSIPAIVVFSIFQTHLVKGLSEGSVKG